MQNTEHFTLLAGNPERFDHALNHAVKGGANLTDVQVEQHRLGRRSAELVCSIYGYGVRSGSGLDDFAILFSPRSLGRWVGRDEAIAWGTKWANEDPDHREFYARNTELNGPEKKQGWERQ